MYLHIAPVAQLDRVLGFEPRVGVRIFPGAPIREVNILYLFILLALVLLLFFWRSYPF